MIPWHKVRIAGEDVDDWVIDVRADQANEPESDKVDIVLANTNGKWTGAFATKDPLEIDLGHDIMQARHGEPTVKEHHEDQILRGEVQYVEYKDDEVLVQGACLVGTLADALPKEFHYHPEDVEAILRDVLGTHDKTIPIKIIKYSQDIKRREEVFKPDWTYQDVCNHLADLVGAIWYLDESGQFVFVDPMEAGETYYIDPWLTTENMAYTCVGRKNVVTVIGGGIYKPGTYGDEVETTETVRSDPSAGRDEESIAAHGELIAPTFYCPYLTTVEQCNKRAQALLQYYKIREDVAKPSVAGITAPLRSILTYSLWGSVIEAMVTKRTLEYSAGGYECHFEASEGAVGASYDQWSNIDVDDLEEIPTEEEWSELEDQLEELEEEEEEYEAPTERQDSYFTADFGGVRYLFADSDLWSELMAEARLFERDLVSERSDGQGMNRIEYNPETGDVMASYTTSDLGDGYYAVLPWSDTTTTDPYVQMEAWQERIS